MSCVVVWDCSCVMSVCCLLMLGIMCLVVFVGVEVCRLVMLLSSG